MDIPINVTVKCADGEVGKSTQIILNPLTQAVTHVVVKGEAEEKLVRIELIMESDNSSIRLRCTQDEFNALTPFNQKDFIWSEVPRQNDLREMDAFGYLPYVTRKGTEWENVPQEDKLVPPNELAVQRGAKVVSSDYETLGEISEFLVNPTNHHISHLVMREGVLWGRKDTTIPMSAIERIQEDTVYLNITTRAVEKLPSVPVRRPWI